MKKITIAKKRLKNAKSAGEALRILEELRRRDPETHRKLTR